MSRRSAPLLIEDIREAIEKIFGRRAVAPSSPRWDLPNVLITPHVGGGGGRQQWRPLSELIRGNTRRYLSGEALKHVVRTPDGKLQGF